MALRLVLISANRHREPYPVYPLATAYLRSYLERELKKVSLDVIDMNRYSDDQLRDYLLESRPDFVGLSLRNVDGANSLDRRGFLGAYRAIVEVIRGASSAPLILGGAAFSIFPEEFMAELGADYGLKGEGEQGLCQLISALSSGASTDGIEDLYCRTKPDLSPRKQYIACPSAVYDPALVEYYWKNSGMLNIQTKRGCPFSCIYCTYPQVDGRVVRLVDIDSIIETMARAKRDFGVNYWFLTDSVFNLNARYNAQLAEAMIAANLQVSWGAYFTPAGLTDEQLALYKAAGLSHIEFGTESLCNETLANYGKRFSFDDVLDASNLALKHGVYYAHFLILAGWGESKAALAETIEHSKLLRHTVFFPYVGMRIYPNTLLHRRCVEEGLFGADESLLEPRYYITPDFDLESCRQMALQTGKAWVFPDDEPSEMMSMLKLKRNKKGPLWEYLRKP